MASGAPNFLREEARPLHAARIRRDDRQIGQIQLAEVAHQHRAGEEVIDGNIEEALNLGGVQIDKQGAIGACGRQQVGDELGADGYARAVFAILAGVAVVGHHHRDPGRRGPLERIDHHQQLHQVLVHRIAGGLHHENIHAAHVLKQLEVDLAVGKALQLGLAHRNPDVLADGLGQLGVGGAAEELEAFVLAQAAGLFALRRRGLFASLALAALPRPPLGASLPPSCSLRAWFALLACLPMSPQRSHFHLKSTSKLVGFGCSSEFKLPNSGWATRIRTWINASKGHCPTIERSPSKTDSRS